MSIYADITPKDFRRLRERHGLTQPQMALLARTPFYPKRSGRLQARRIQAWENGESRIPLAHYELIQIKLKLLQSGVTFDELVKPGAALLYISEALGEAMAAV